MEPDQKYVAVGAFILLTVVGLVGFGLWVGKSLQQSRRACYLMRFDNSVAGLSEGGNVSFRGVTVGQVERIRINPENDTQILVRAMLDSKTPIHPNTVAQLKPQGITGASYIELDVRPGVNQSNRPVTDDGPLADCRAIVTLPSDIQKIINTLPGILDQAQQVVERLSGLLNADNARNVQVSLENLNRITTDLTSQTAVVGPEITQAVQQLRVTAANLNSLTTAISVGAQANVQDVQAAVRQTTAAMSEIRGLAQDLRDDPKRLLVSPKPSAVQVPK